jgi:methylated-DNA-[protein]-cysteine S-methyltransferase
MSNATFSTTMSSPVGRLTLVGQGDDLIGLYFDKDPLAAKMRADSGRDDRRLRQAVEQLEEYFAGARTQFDLSLVPPGTAFQKKVWAALVGIPYGETATYGQIARAVGRPDASRAVGGGLPRKRLLLDLETRTASSGQLGLPGAL